MRSQRHVLAVSESPCASKRFRPAARLRGRVEPLNQLFSAKRAQTHKRSQKRWPTPRRSGAAPAATATRRKRRSPHRVARRSFDEPDGAAPPPPPSRTDAVLRIEELERENAAARKAEAEALAKVHELSQRAEGDASSLDEQLEKITKAHQATISVTYRASSRPRARREPRRSSRSSLDYKQLWMLQRRRRQKH